jgi:cyclopropane fatty-acyl-phospholipid synthase-like methyltransferase
LIPLFTEWLSAFSTAFALGLCFEDCLILQDWENFGPDDVTTVMTWRTNFDSAWPSFAQDITPAF